ncbi:MAG TPA: hypothetical protein VFB59_01370 [Candidatus Saccharimonadales bacterium]|nr:hypothetical protein [Candidatus Saccharimonadales bacterium]
MSHQQEPQSKADPQAANNGSAAALSEEALRNLAGFFDVLIQMDFAQKRKAKEDGNNDEHATGTARATNNNGGTNNTG